jgi:hypothetical protein
MNWHFVQSSLNILSALILLSDESDTQEHFRFIVATPQSQLQTEV